jgi:hypothetical protein
MAKSEKVVEAILQASDNGTVADYLVRRAADPVDPEWIRLWGRISKEGEFALLERGDRLIDLRLAEFCQHKTTARALFHRDDEDTVLRALVLSNRAQSFALPEALFRDITEEEWKDDPERHPLYRVESLLQRITLEEVQALFENPAISESFLAKFLMASHYPRASRVMYWKALPPEMRHQALWALSRNPLLQRWASESRKGAVAVDRLGCTNAAWGLLRLLDVTVPNVQALAELCEQLAVVWARDLAESLQRWIPQDDEERERELEDNRQRRLSAYQRVRRAASAALLIAGSMSQKDLLQSDDLALRCGAYMGGGFSLLDVPMTPELMQQGIRRDGWFAAQSMLQNPVCWKTAEGREVMLSSEARESDPPPSLPIVDAYVQKRIEDVSEADLKAWVENLTPEDRADLDPFLNNDDRYEPASYEELKDRLRTQQQSLEKFHKEHPEWFTDESQKVGDDQSAITATQFAQIRKTLKNLTLWQSIQFCLLVGALAVLFFR